MANGTKVPPIADEDGGEEYSNTIDNHCPICNEFESECLCAEADEADSALADEDNARVAQAEYDQRWYR